MERLPKYLNKETAGKNLKPFVIRIVGALIEIKEESGGFSDDIEHRLYLKTRIDNSAIMRALGRLRKLHIWRNNDIDMEMLELVCRSQYRFIQVIPEVGFNHRAIRAEKARLAIGDIGADEPMGEMVALRLKYVRQNWRLSASATLQDEMETEIRGMVDEGVLIASKPIHDMARETILALREGVLDQYSVGYSVRPE